MKVFKIEIEAINIEDTISKVKEMYQKEEIVLDNNNYVNTTITQYLE